MTKNIFRLIALVAMIATAAFGQTALSNTTFSSAVSETDSYVYVTSATGITAPTTATNTVLYAGRELMRVTSVDGTRIGVLRGRETPRQAHVSGATLYLGEPDAFYASAPIEGGACSAPAYSPLIHVATGDRFYCDSVWYRLAGPILDNGGTAAAGVTAIHYGDNRNRRTKLTFTGMTLGPTVANANEAYGVLLFTLPTGKHVAVEAAEAAVTLTISTTCVADDPDIGLGTTIASGAQATLNAVAATAEDILTGQTSVNGAVASVSVVQTVALNAGSSARKVHLNIADGWAGGECTISGAGVAHVQWTKLN